MMQEALMYWNARDWSGISIGGNCARWNHTGTIIFRQVLSQLDRLDYVLAGKILTSYNGEDWKTRRGFYDRQRLHEAGHYAIDQLRDGSFCPEIRDLSEKRAKEMALGVMNRMLRGLDKDMGDIIVMENLSVLDHPPAPAPYIAISYHDPDIPTEYYRDLTGLCLWILADQDEELHSRLHRHLCGSGYNEVADKLSDHQKKLCKGVGSPRNHIRDAVRDLAESIPAEEVLNTEEDENIEEEEDGQ